MVFFFSVNLCAKLTELHIILIYLKDFKSALCKNFSKTF